jgi:hypothetical protein
MSLVSTAIEQAVMLSGATIVSVVAAVIVYPEHSAVILCLGLVTVIGFVVASTRFPDIARWIVRKRFPKSDSGKLIGLDALSVLKFSLSYVVPWVLSGAIFSVIYFSLFDVAVTVDRIAALVLANTIGITIGFFAFFAPGGIGIREAVTSGILATSFPLREALLAAVAYRALLVIVDGLNAVLIIFKEVQYSRLIAAKHEHQASS